MMFRQLRNKYAYSVILLRELVRTDFKLRYQGSVLGYMWSLLRPMFLFVILYLVFVVVFNAGGDMPHWPVALLIGIVLWSFFTEITNAGVTSIVNRGDVIRKINFPKYTIVLASSLSALINLGLNLVVVCIFLIINGVPIQPSIMLAPLYIGELFLFGLGIAFLLSAIYVRYRDINFIWEIILQGMLYASIVLYPASMILEKHHTIATFLLLNPVAQVIQDVRFTVVSDQYATLMTTTNGWYMLIPLSIVAVIFVCGAWYFRRRSATFAEDI